MSKTKISTTNAAIILIAAAIAFATMLLTSYPAVAQSNVTQEAASSANQT